MAKKEPGAVAEAPERPAVLTCRSPSCKARVFFAKGPRGNQMIFDAEPVAADSKRGLWVLTSEQTARSARAEDPGPFFASHFGTCPDAFKWRKDKEKK